MIKAKVSGLVHAIMETKLVGQKQFPKRTVVIEHSGDRFADYIPVELSGEEACSSADNLSVGDTFEADCIVGGRKWQRDASTPVAYFIHLSAFRYTTKSDSPTKTRNEPVAAAASGYEEEIPF